MVRIAVKCFILLALARAHDLQLGHANMPARLLNDKIAPLRTLLSPKQMQDALLLAATALALYLCWLLVRPFLAVITWAVALAVVAHPIHAWLERRTSRPTLAALLAVVLVVLVVVGPGVYIMQKLYDETTGTVREMRAGSESRDWNSVLQAHPRVASSLAWLMARAELDAAAKELSAWLAARAPSIFTKSIWALAQMVITVLTLFYFFRDRKKVLDLIRRLVPLSRAETDVVFRRVSQTMYASLYGSIAVKAVQGLLGGLAFWILGLPAPVLSGAAMSLCAILPLFGTALVWGPAAVWLALNGSWVKALVLAVWGTLVIGQIDNVLYPMLVAGELRLHPLSVFFSVLGGLMAFGASGVVLGPVILAVTFALLEIWRLRTSGEGSGA